MGPDQVVAPEARSKGPESPSVGTIPNNSAVQNIDYHRSSRPNRRRRYDSGPDQASEQKVRDWDDGENLPGDLASLGTSFVGTDGNEGPIRGGGGMKPSARSDGRQTLHTHSQPSGDASWS